MRVIRLVVLLPLASWIVACGGSDSTTTPPSSHNKTVDVFTLSTAFSPNVVQLSAGDTIRFNITPSQNGEPHNVIFVKQAGAPADIQPTSTGVITRVFSTKGNFHFDCTIHPGMSGDVQVQ
jgi:plastocyanin